MGIKKVIILVFAHLSMHTYGVRSASQVCMADQQWFHLMCYTVRQALQLRRVQGLGFKPGSCLVFVVGILFAPIGPANEQSQETRNKAWFKKLVVYSRSEREGAVNLSVHTHHRAELKELRSLFCVKW